MFSSLASNTQDEAAREGNTDVQTWRTEESGYAPLDLDKEREARIRSEVRKNSRNSNKAKYSSGHSGSADFFGVLAGGGDSVNRGEIRHHLSSDEGLPQAAGNGHTHPSIADPSLETILDSEEIARCLVTRFRSSGFLQSVVEYVDARQKDIQSHLEKQLNQLRSENASLRQQLRPESALDAPLNVPESMVQPGTSPARGFKESGTIDELFVSNTGTSRGGEGETLLANNPDIKKASTQASLVTASSVPVTELDSPRTPAPAPLAHNCSGRRRHGGVNFGGRMSQAIRQSKGSVRSAHGEHGVFADIDTMKAEIRAAIFRKPYNVAQYYKETGWCPMIAKSIWFDYLTLSVIFSNSIWIAVDVDLNTASSINEADFGFQFMEYFFFVYFCVEWIIRFCAFRNKRDSMNDWWFIFDTGLVVMMIADLISIQVAGIVSTEADVDKGRGDTNAAILRLLRLTKLTRMARMARLLRAMPELTILVKGIWVATRSVFFTLCLLAILIYVFAVAFRQLTDDTALGDRYFPSVPKGMKSLLLYGTLPDFSPMVEDVGAEHIFLGILLLFFILLGSLTVMNMLVGVLVEVVSVVSAVEKEELKVNFVKSQLMNILKKSEIHPDLVHEEMTLSRADFEFLFLKQGAAKVFNDIGVDPIGFVDTSAYIFKEAGEQGVSFGQFIELVLSMRGTNTATVKDMLDLRRVMLEKMEILEMHIRDGQMPQRQITQSPNRQSARLSPQPPPAARRPTHTSQKSEHDSRIDAISEQGSRLDGGSSFYTMHSHVSNSAEDEVDVSAMSIPMSVH